MYRRREIAPTSILSSCCLGKGPREGHRNLAAEDIIAEEDIIAAEDMLAAGKLVEGKFQVEAELHMRKPVDTHLNHREHTECILLEGRGVHMQVHDVLR